MTSWQSDRKEYHQWGTGNMVHLQMLCGQEFITCLGNEKEERLEKGRWNRVGRFKKYWEKKNLSERQREKEKEEKNHKERIYYALILLNWFLSHKLSRLSIANKQIKKEEKP